MIWYPSISVFRNGLDAVRQASERVCEEGASRVGSREACRGASPMERDIGAGWDYDEYITMVEMRLSAPPTHQNHRLFTPHWQTIEMIGRTLREQWMVRPTVGVSLVQFQAVFTWARTTMMVYRKPHP